MYDKIHYKLKKQQQKKNNKKKQKKNKKIIFCWGKKKITYTGLLSVQTQSEEEEFGC